jgi:hypothetical protein
MGPMTGPGHLYESLGHGYAAARRPDPRIAAQIAEVIGESTSVLNVGAGTGNYEPADRLVIAAEPSPTMLEQRSSSHPVVRSIAEALPFADDTRAPSGARGPGRDVATGPTRAGVAGGGHRAAPPSHRVWRLGSAPRLAADAGSLRRRLPAGAVAPPLRDGPDWGAADRGAG